MLSSNEVDTISNSCKDPYLYEKECEEKLPQGLQSITVTITKITATIQENANKKNVCNTCGLWPFKHPVYPHGLKEDLIVKLELNFSGKVNLRSGDTITI